MAFKSLLLSKDAELVQTLARLLKDLDIAVEPCSEPFAAAKRLMDQHFDAILVDCEDEQGAGWVLQSARMATASKKSITIAIVGAQNQNGPRAGENFVIQKPIVLKQVEGTLRAARGLMGDSGSSPSSSAPIAPSVTVPKPVVSFAAPTAHESAPGQGRPSPEFYDDLTAVVDRLGPQAAPPKPAPVASGLGSAAAPAPALEKPVMAMPPAVVPPIVAPPAPVPAITKPAASAPEPAPRVEPAPVPRPAPPAWQSLAAKPSEPKSEVAALLPLAAAEVKPAVRPVPDLAKSSDPFEDRRRRMETSAPPTWRAGVEERHEAPVPRFSGFAEEEETGHGFPFKKIAVVMVLVSLALYGYSWYREHGTAGAPQTLTPATSVESQAPAPAPQPRNAAPAPAQTSPSQNVASAPQDNFGGDRTPEVEPPTPKPRSSQSESAPKKAAEIVAADTTTNVDSSDTGLPPAPLVVESGKRSHAPAHVVEPVAPPSLNTVASAAKPGLGGVVAPAPVDLPKLASAAPQRIRVSQGVTQGLLVHQVQPQYPAMARENRVEGDVVLDAVIGKDGLVKDVKVVSGPSLLVRSAVLAVRQWRYKPYLLNAQPVEVVTQVKLQFRL